MLDERSPLRTAKYGDIFIFRAEMGWKMRAQCSINEMPTITPGCKFLMYNKDILAQLRPVSVQEIWMAQGFVPQDFELSWFQLHKMVPSATDAMSLPGRSFHLSSFSSFALGALSNRQIR